MDCFDDNLIGFDKFPGKLFVCRDITGYVEIRAKITGDAEECETITVNDLFCNISPDPKCGRLKIHEIVSINLSYCKLTDLPTTCLIPNLKHLVLSHNNFDKVPACLYSCLKYLESLDLSHNKIDHFDMVPECLKNIKELKLNNNRMKWLPEWLMIFRCTNLEELNFSSNAATHYKFFRNSYNLNIIQLRKLKLRNCHLRDSDYGFLKCFRKLEYLDISNKDRNTINKLYEADDLFVRPKWEQLKVLRMNHLSLSVFPEGIAWLETLTELRINNNSISWLSDGMQFMVNLEILDISYNTIVTISPVIAKLECLAVLLAQNNNIDSVPDFTLMPSLRVLDLYNNVLGNVCFDGEKLEAMDLEGNYLSTTDFPDYETYATKKETLRKTHKNTGNRFDGPIARRRESFTSTVSRTSSKKTGSWLYSDDEESVSGDCVKTFNSFDLDDTEDWDSPAEPSNKNPAIDSGDEEWRGYEETGTRMPEIEEEKVYIADEDWMFVDASGLF